jgi:hypothetical protein
MRGRLLDGHVVMTMVAQNPRLPWLKCAKMLLTKRVEL